MTQQHLTNVAKICPAAKARARQHTHALAHVGPAITARFLQKLASFHYARHGCGLAHVGLLRAALLNCETPKVLLLCSVAVNLGCLCRRMVLRTWSSCASVTVMRRRLWIPAVIALLMVALSGCAAGNGGRSVIAMDSPTSVKSLMAARKS